MITLKFNNSYIKSWYSIGGVDEEKGNIKDANKYMSDLYYGEKTHEKAEIKMIEEVIRTMKKDNKVDLIVGGNLSNQLGTMNMALRDINTSFLGLYSACATFTESIIASSSLIQNKAISNALVITNSHSLTSERQFRFPVEYGSLKNCYTTNTITAAVGVIVSNEKSPYKVSAATIGGVVDYGIKDVANMGAIMAPAAALVIKEHLSNTKTTHLDYDYILTGDLGSVGITLLQSVLKDDYGIITDKIIDAGSIIYKKSQNKCAGGSGPTCLPFAFFNRFIQDKKIKRVLLVGTGALHNPTLVNQKNSIPSIAHLIEIEVNHDAN